MIKCEKCGGTLVLRTSKFGQFIGCSNYPKCDYKSNNIDKFILDVGTALYNYFENKGINMYGWEGFCYKCHSPIIYGTYLLNLQLTNQLNDFRRLVNNWGDEMPIIPTRTLCGCDPGIGDIETIDDYLVSQYPKNFAIRKSFTTGLTHGHVICSKCNAHQGYNYVVADSNIAISSLHNPGKWEDNVVLKFKPSECGLTPRILGKYALKID